MNIQLIIISMMILLIMAGCSFYETKEDKQGRTIRVNRITGEVVIIDGDKIVKVKNEKEVADEKARDDALGITKEWSNQMILNDTPVNLKTKWVDGVMSYLFVVYGNLRDRSDYFSQVNVELKDKEGFKISLIPIKANMLTGLVGLDGKTVLKMQISDQIPLSKDEYRRIASWDVTWSGFNK